MHGPSVAVWWALYYQEVQEGVKMTGRGDKFIKLGFWSQLVLLFLVDLGSVLAFARYDVAWYHYVGFAIVNILLLWATWMMWTWLKPQRTAPLSFGVEE